MARAKGSRSKFVPGYGVVFLPNPDLTPKQLRGTQLAVEREPAGLQVATTPGTPEARKVFTPGELRARLLAHRRRILRECPESLRHTMLGPCRDQLE
jgi:hypothetical protein